MFVFNNYARQELAKFILDGANPLPHPDDFVKAIDDLYQSDFHDLCNMVAYCGYLGFCYEKRTIPDLSFSRFPEPKDGAKIWIEFLKAEGVFIQFTEPIPEGTGRGKVRWEDILSYAFGEMGLMPDQFYRMTMADYAIMCNGYFWKRWRPDEYLRTILYTIRSVFRSKKDSMPPNVESFYPLPSDKKGIVHLQEHEIKKMWEIAKKM